VKILFVAPRYDYGDRARGLSFEHDTFYDCLRHMGHEVIYFDFISLFQERGRAFVSARLCDVVCSEKPDLLFSVLFEDEINVDAVAHISQHTDTVTLNWFCDDHWRFESFTRYWVPAYNWVATTARSALPRYAAIGYRNVIKTQWACNHFLFRPLQCVPEYDVSFVGQPHGRRRETIHLLRTAGIDVRAWGYGWEAGRLNREEMVEVFNSSRINLNFAGASTFDGPESRWRGRYRRLTGIRRRLPGQIKARNFEVPGCAGFLLTDVAEDLRDYYAPGTEIGTFRGERDLVREVRHYLDRDGERQSIAQAGYRRTMADHTMERRLNEIFARMGLETTAPASESC
jgi:spore maturation protein CgeB